MTPGHDWRREYAGRPVALAKLEYCDRVVREVAGTAPTLVVTEDEDDEGYDFFGNTLADLYGEPEEADELPGLDGALRSAFEDADDAPAGDRRPVGELLRRVEADLVASVFRWTGHFPERTLPLVRRIARRADELGQVYRPGREAAAVVAVTALVTALAMNHVHTGEYVPGEHPPAGPDTCVEPADPETDP
jgi:hypothetical protein